MSDRITEIEVKMAFQEHQLAELDEVLRALRDDVERLQQELRELREQAPAGDEDPDQRPPHY